MFDDVTTFERYVHELDNLKKTYGARNVNEVSVFMSQLEPELFKEFGNFAKKLNLIYVELNKRMEQGLNDDAPKPSTDNQKSLWNEN